MGSLLVFSKLVRISSADPFISYGELLLTRVIYQLIYFLYSLVLSTRMVVGVSLKTTDQWHSQVIL